MTYGKRIWNSICNGTMHLQILTPPNKWVWTSRRVTRICQPSEIWFVAPFPPATHSHNSESDSIHSPISAFPLLQISFRCKSTTCPCLWGEEDVDILRKTKRVVRILLTNIDCLSWGATRLHRAFALGHNKGQTRREMDSLLGQSFYQTLSFVLKWGK